MLETHNKLCAGSVILTIDQPDFLPTYKKNTVFISEEVKNQILHKFGNRHFWAEGYYVSTVGLNEATIKKYIQEQESHDIEMDKLSVKEYEYPFKG